MNYEKFQKEIQTRIRDFLPEEFQTATVSMTQVTRNNSTNFDAISIRDEGQTVAPLIYTKALFEDYEKGAAMEEILQNIAKTYLQERNEDFENVSNFITDYNVIKDRLLLRVVSKTNNEEMLRNTPHKDVDGTDLTATLFVKVNGSNDVSGMIRVQQPLLSVWGKDLDSLYQQALQNTVEQRPATVTDMYTILFNLGNSSKGAVDVSNFKINPYNQYVLSNVNNTLGAATMLYPDVLQKLSENANANLFILPSSIHELILIQDTGEMSAEELQSMVMFINHDEVEPEEVLSNEVYYYDRDSHTLSMATEKEKTAELAERMKDVSEPYSAQEEMMERG